MERHAQKGILTAITIGLTLNVILSLGKLGFGLWGNANALISDGLNSFTDIFISILLLIVLRIATKKPDDDHPYGHEKFEGLAYFVLGIIFMIASLLIAYYATTSMVQYIQNPLSKPSPHPVTLWVSIGALFIKFGLYRYYVTVGKRYDSTTIKADAQNHYLDFWATLASVIGLLLAQTKWIIFDDVAALVISGFIFRLAFQILKEAVSYLVDQSPDQHVIETFQEAIMSVKGVLSIDDLKVRKHMNRCFIDVEIGVDESLTLKESHQIATRVHDKIEKKYSNVIHVMVHVNPHKK